MSQGGTGHGGVGLNLFKELLKQTTQQGQGEMDVKEEVERDSLTKLDVGLKRVHEEAEVGAWVDMSSTPFIL